MHFRSASEVEKWRRSPRSHAQNRAADLDELQEDAVQRERDVYEATVQNTVAYGEEEEDAGTSSELSSPERPRRSTVNVSERSSPPHGPSRPQKASPHPRRRGLPLVASRKPLSSNGPLGAKRGISSKDTLPGTTDERPDSFAEVAQLKRDPIGRLEHFMENNQHPPRRLGSCPVPLPPPDEEESEVQEKLDEPRIDDPEAGPRAPESGDSEAVDDAQTAHSHPPNGPSDFKSSSPIPCPSRLYTSASEASQPLVTDAVFTATQLGMVPPASSSSQMGFVSAPSRSAQAPPPNEDAIEMLREASGQRERQASNASTSTNVPPSRQLKRITGPPSEDSQPVRARPLPIQYDIPRKPTQHGTLIESVGRGGGVQETFIDEPVEAVESRGAARGQAKGEDIRGDHTASDPVAHPAGSEPTTNAARRELIQAAPRGESPPCDDLDELDILKAPSASGSKASLTNAHEAPQVRADAPGPSIPTRPVRKRKSRSMSRVEDASHSDSSGSIQPDPEDYTYLPEKTKRRLNGKARSSSSRSVRGSERPRDDPDGHNPNINVPSRAPEVPILFAHWRAGRYFLGRPTKRIGDLYHFIFLDEEETSVDLHHMRFGSLRVDDVFRHQEVVYGKGGPRLAQVFDGGDTIYVTDGGIRDLPAAEIWLNVTDIKKHFNDRRVSHEDLSAVKVEPANGAQTVASRVMNHSSRQGVPPPSKAKQVSAHSTILEGLVFLTTSADVTDFHTGAIIAANGGELVNEWQALFEPAPDHFGSTFGIESGKTVFLVTAKPTPTPKLMIALAKGVPCLSHTFVRDAVELVRSSILLGDSALMSRAMCRTGART